jgi:hypothetical protein
MRNVDDLYTVVELACLTEDRADREQASLLRVAAKIDNELNAEVVTNRRPRTAPASRLLEWVEQSRVLSDGQREVVLPAKALAAWERRVERWGQPV